MYSRNIQPATAQRGEGHVLVSRRAGLSDSCSLPVFRDLPPPAGNRAFLEYYRCPEEFARCLPVDAPSQPGYFRFGPEAICYGSLSGAAAQPRVSGELHDALNDIVFCPTSVRLPFDAEGVVDNLRFERYCNEPGTGSPAQRGLAAKLYYFARPFLGVHIRRHLQKLKLGDWRSIPFPRWPVDTTVEQVHETMLRLSLQASGVKKLPFIWFWPRRSSSCAMVTHDVETAKGRDFCPELMRIDTSFGIKSSFQLIPEERYTLRSSSLDEIRSQGFEINVHDLNHDGKLFGCEKTFLERVSRINEYGRVFAAEGFRSGALYRNIAWYKALEFSYDMSVPNVAHLDPQHGGCCTVMPYFIGRILELPVTMTQDYSLFHVLNEYSIDLWKSQIQRVVNQHGLLSSIVHPDYIIEKRARNTYTALLAYLADLRSRQRVWTALPREVNQWWRARTQMRLVRCGNEWVVEGPQNDRATVAYATLDGDRVAYEFA